VLKAPAREFQRFFWLPILLLISACSTAKDVSTYVADSQKQESKIAEMRSSGVDESTIKKQEEARVPMTPPCCALTPHSLRCLPRTALLSMTAASAWPLRSMHCAYWWRARARRELLRRRVRSCARQKRRLLRRQPNLTIGMLEISTLLLLRIH
jgi:hypothetical protein